jgi:hypothetical protein
MMRSHNLKLEEEKGEEEKKTDNKQQNENKY